MAQVSFELQKYTILEGGVYGPGLDNDSDVELIECAVGNEANPPWDKDGTGERAPWLMFKIKVTLNTGEEVFLRDYVGATEGNKLRKKLLAIGAPFNQDENTGACSFDTDEVEGRKLRGIEVQRPRETEDGRVFNGRIKTYLG